MIQFLSKYEVYSTLIIIAIGILVLVFSNSLISKTLEKKKNIRDIKRHKTIKAILSKTIKWVVIVLMITTALSVYGLNVKTLLTGLGIVGIVFGLAMQNTIKDYLGGFRILFDDYFYIGDVIEVTTAKYKGEVIDLSLRTTILKTLEGDIVKIANRNIDNCINFSKNKTEIYLSIMFKFTDDLKLIDKTLVNIVKKINELEFVYSEETRFQDTNEINHNYLKYILYIKCKSRKNKKVKKEAVQIVVKEISKSNLAIPE